VFSDGLTTASSLTAARLRFGMNVKSPGWATAADPWAFGPSSQRRAGSPKGNEVQHMEETLTLHTLRTKQLDEATRAKEWRWEFHEIPRARDLINL
jgi:hypothetical protein